MERVLLEFVSQLECVPCEFVDKPQRVKPAVAAVEAESPAIDVEVWDGKTLRGTRDGDRRAEQVLVRMQALLGTVQPVMTIWSTCRPTPPNSTP